MIIKAPAKINLGLRILNKRDDGFHNLETIFYPVKLFDTINISIVPSGSDMNSIILKSEKHSVPLAKTNTLIKVIEAFFKNFKIRDTYLINIFLEKNIPIGGGLGGGSSDAGSLLRYLVNFFRIDINLNRKLIMDTALAAGSDVPFFLIQKPCYATGRGEKMKILNNFVLDYDVLLVNPNRHVATKWAYESLNFDESMNKEPILADVEKFDLSRPELYINDFEKVVFEKYPELAEVKSSLLDCGASFASLSGSGAVLYGLFSKENSAGFRKARKLFQSSGYFVFPAV